MTKPTRHLWCWQLYRLPKGNGFIVAGDDAATGHGQISSVFIEFDAKTLSGTTVRERPYQLSFEHGNQGIHLQTLSLLARWCELQDLDLDDLKPVSPIEVEATLSITEEDHLVLVDWSIIQKPDGVHVLLGNSVSSAGSLHIGVDNIAEFDADTLIGKAGYQGGSRFRLHGDGTDLIPLEDFEMMSSWLFPNLASSDLKVVSPQELADALAARGPKP